MSEQMISLPTRVNVFWSYHLPCCWVFSICTTADGLSQHDAGVKLPATEAACLWGLLCIPRHSRQWSASRRSLRWQTSCWLYHPEIKAGRTAGLYLAVPMSSYLSPGLNLYYSEISVFSIEFDFVINW